VKSFFQGPTPCKLSVQMDEGPIFVAHGRLYPSGPGVAIHNNPLPPDHVRVCIDSVIEGLAHVRVPCPVDDTEYIGELVGTFVAWPAHLVELPDKVFLLFTTLLIYTSKKIMSTQFLKFLNAGLEETGPREEETMR